MPPLRETADGAGSRRGLRAAVAQLEGDAREPERRLSEAVGIFEWMAAQGIRNPRFMIRMIAPGFPDV